MSHEPGTDMKAFLLAICLACLAATALVAWVALDSVEPFSVLVAGLALWAAVPALIVTVSVVVVRKRARVARLFGVGGLAVVVAGAALEYVAIRYAPDVFTGPIFPLLLIPIMQNIVLMFVAFAAASIASESASASTPSAV